MAILLISISFRVTSLAPGQSYNCPSANEATLKDMGKWIIWIQKKHYNVTKNEAASKKFTYYTWELWCQKHVSQPWISNCIPQHSVGCIYLSMPKIHTSGTKILIYITYIQTSLYMNNKFNVSIFYGIYCVIYEWWLHNVVTGFMVTSCHGWQGNLVVNLISWTAIC